MRAAFNKDFVLGGLLVALGAAAAWIASGYPQGTLRFMGPGFAPRWLGVAVAALGLLILLRGLRAERAVRNEAHRVAWRPLLLVPLAPLLFGLLVPRGGLLIASFVTVLTVGATIPALGPRMVVFTAAVLAAGFTILFAVLLRVPLPVWPA